jgi:hypothetical protein
MTMDDPERLREALKLVAVELKTIGVPFALAGGFAAWVHGAPESAHDVDFLIGPEDAPKVAEQLRRHELDVVQPPEDWLFKVSVLGVTVDVLHRASDEDVAGLLDRAEPHRVLSVEMPVLSATDVAVEKLCALDEHNCDLASVLPVLRAMREQVAWDDVRHRVDGNPFAVSMLFLLVRLEVIGGAAAPWT